MRATALSALLLLAVVASPALAGRTQLGPRLQQRQHQQQGAQLATSGNPPTPPAACAKQKKTGSYEDIHYSIEHPVANYLFNCQHTDNKPCTDYGEKVVYDQHAFKTGCNLYAKGIHICQSSSAATSCPSTPATAGFAYSGDFTNCDHVITIAKDPIRGLEDVWLHGDSYVKDHWKAFWHDSTSTTPGQQAGHDRTSSFDADTGALVINPAAHREFHQLHIHSGTWRTKQFDACLNALPPAALKPGTWHSTVCKALSEAGTGADQADAHLAYQVIDKKDLDKAWGLWKDAVQNHVNVQGGGKKLVADEAAFFSGLLVTRRSAPKLPTNEVIVAAYWPTTTAKHDGLGRGHFVMKGKPNDKCV